jgi:hypothetical protein
MLGGARRHIRIPKRLNPHALAMIDCASPDRRQIAQSGSRRRHGVHAI